MPIALSGCSGKIFDISARNDRSHSGDEHPADASSSPPPSTNLRRFCRSVSGNCHPERYSAKDLASSTSAVRLHRAWLPHQPDPSLHHPPRGYLTLAQDDRWWLHSLRMTVYTHRRFHRNLLVTAAARRVHR